MTLKDEQSLRPDHRQLARDRKRPEDGTTGRDEYSAEEDRRGDE